MCFWGCSMSKLTHTALTLARSLAMKLVNFVLCCLVLACTQPPVSAQHITVCVTAQANCDFYGPGATQQAVDAARSGDIITLSTGRHIAATTRDVAFADLLVRGGTVIHNKSLTLIGSNATYLETTTAAPASVLVVHRGSLTLENVLVRAAPPESTDDDIYDGHGLFLVDAHAEVKNVTFKDIEKMAISVRGDSSVEANKVNLLDGHVGVWVEEAGRATLTDCSIVNNDSAAVAAYMQAQVVVNRCVLENNADDGLYAAATAQITAQNTLFLRNAPYAARAVDEARIAINGSVFYDNAENINDATRVHLEDSLSHSMVHSIQPQP